VCLRAVCALVVGCAELADLVADSIFNHVAGPCTDAISFTALSDYLIKRGDVPLDKVQSIFNALDTNGTLCPLLPSSSLPPCVSAAAAHLVCGHLGCMLLRRHLCYRTNDCAMVRCRQARAGDGSVDRNEWRVGFTKGLIPDSTN
jgi:hypothetical protein